MPSPPPLPRLPFSPPSPDPHARFAFTTSFDPHTTNTFTDGTTTYHTSETTWETSHVSNHHSRGTATALRTSIQASRVRSGAARGMQSMPMAVTEGARYKPYPRDRAAKPKPEVMMEEDEEEGGDDGPDDMMIDEDGIMLPVAEGAEKEAKKLRRSAYEWALEKAVDWKEVFENGAVVYANEFDDGEVKESPDNLYVQIIVKETLPSGQIKEHPPFVVEFAPEPRKPAAAAAGVAPGSANPDANETPTNEEGKKPEEQNQEPNESNQEPSQAGPSQLRSSQTSSLGPHKSFLASSQATYEKLNAQDQQVIFIGRQPGCQITTCSSSGRSRVSVALMVLRKTRKVVLMHVGGLWDIKRKKAVQVDEKGYPAKWGQEVWEGKEDVYEMGMDEQGTFVIGGKGWDGGEDEGDRIEVIVTPCKLCLICQDNPRQIHFRSCQHFVTCSTCLPSLTSCPICRADIARDKLNPIKVGGAPGRGGSGRIDHRTNQAPAPAAYGLGGYPRNPVSNMPMREAGWEGLRTHQADEPGRSTDMRNAWML